MTTCVLTLIFIVAAWRVIPEGEGGDRHRLPWRRLALLGISVLLVGASGQFPDIALRVGFILAGIFCLWMTLRLDIGENGIFPKRVLSLFAPIGTAYWVFLLLSAAYTPLTILMPLALSTLYGLHPLWIGYMLTGFQLPGQSARWEQRAGAKKEPVSPARAASPSHQPVSPLSPRPSGPLRSGNSPDTSRRPGSASA